MKLFKPKKIYWLSTLLMVIAIFLAACSPATTTGLALEVDVEEAYSLREQGAFILDVRQPEEWEAGHIPDATLIPLGELENRVSEIPQDETIVVVCRSGNRSATGRDILLDAGFTDVTSMGGGMNDWTNQGYEVVTGP
jgi:rhodanese-related sulfurtransferase